MSRNSGANNTQTHTTCTKTLPDWFPYTTRSCWQENENRKRSHYAATRATRVGYQNGTNSFRSTEARFMPRSTTNKHTWYEDSGSFAFRNKWRSELAILLLWSWLRWSCPLIPVTLYTLHGDISTLPEAVFLRTETRSCGDKVRWNRANVVVVLSGKALTVLSTLCMVRGMSRLTQYWTRGIITAQLDCAGIISSDATGLNNNNSGLDYDLRRCWQPDRLNPPGLSPLPELSE